MKQTVYISVQMQLVMRKSMHKPSRLYLLHIAVVHAMYALDII